MAFSNTSRGWTKSVSRVPSEISATRIRRRRVLSRRTWKVSTRRNRLAEDALGVGGGGLAGERGGRDLREAHQCVPAGFPDDVQVGGWDSAYLLPLGSHPFGPSSGLAEPESAG